MKIFFRLWQWTWGFPQTLFGSLVYLLYRKHPHENYHGCVVTYWDHGPSLGVGMFLFVSQRHYREDPQLLVHEFGHAVQSAILGPLFLPIMGIPSLLWGSLPVFRRLRREKGISYFSFYSESSANHLGSLVTGESCELV